MTYPFSHKADGAQAGEIEPRPTESRHLGFLDGVRGLAAAYVVLHHESMHIYSLGPSLAQRLLALALRFGHYPVDVFIVLSGYCLMLPVSRAGGRLGGTRRFLVRRATRILPTYYAALALSILLIATCLGSQTGTHWDETLPLTWSSVWQHVFLMQDLFTGANHRLNYAMWSISVEWRIYFLFPLILVAAQRYGLARTVATVFVSSFLLLIPLRWVPINTDAYGLCPGYVGLFALGMLACDLSVGSYAGVPIDRKKLSAGLVAGTILLIGLSVSPWAPHVQEISALTGILAASLLLGIHRGYFPALGRAFSAKPVAALGVIGYSLYLFHPPLVHMVWLYLVHPLGLSSRSEQLLLLASTPLVLLGCYGAFLLFERPVLNLRSGKRPRHPG